MTSASPQTQARLFRFNVPGPAPIPEPGPALAVPIEQLVGVARLPMMTRIPCAPPAILGLSRWQETPVTVVDMHRLLDPAAQPDEARDTSEMHHMIVKIAVENQISLVGCPILAGGQMLTVPMALPRAPIPAEIASDMVHQAVLLDDGPLLLLDLMRLPALIASTNPLFELQ